MYFNINALPCYEIVDTNKTNFNISNVNANSFSQKNILDDTEERIVNLLNENPEYKIIHSFDFVYNSKPLFKFIYNNVNEHKVNNDLHDTIFFSIYYFLIVNGENLNQFTLNEIFKNLKKLILLNKSKDTSLFYYETIYKSIFFLNKFANEDMSFYNDLNGEKLEEILDYLPELLIKIKNQYEKSNENEFNSIGINIIKKIIDQILLFYRTINQNNESFNKVNKDMVSFFIKNMSTYISGNYNIYKENDKNSLSLSITKSNSINSNLINIKEVKNEINFDNISHNQSKASKKEQILINHYQESASNKIQDQNENNYLILKKELMMNNNLILSCKVKKFSDNHITKEKFKEKFLLLQNIGETDIHCMLEKVASEYYKVQLNFCLLQKENLEIVKLREEFSEIFNQLTIDLIGSCSLGIFTNIKNRTTIDLIILPINKNKNPIENLNVFINNLKEFNDESKSHKFAIDDIEDEHLENFYCNLVLDSKRSETKFNSNIYILREDLKISNDILKDFFKIENLRILNIFFQEILITKIKICEYRSDISLLIFAFIDFFYNVLDKEKIEKTYVSLRFNIGDILSSNSNNINIKSRKLNLEKEKCYYYKLNIFKLDAINMISPGELIIEFLRYIINFLNYLKLLFNKSTHAKNMEFYKAIYEQDHLNSDFYLFNIRFMYKYLELKQEVFNIIFLSFIYDMEDIFFKICENSHLIKNFDHIIQNINKRENI